MVENISRIIEKLREIQEPETNASIVDLGLIDRVEVDGERVMVYVNFSYIRSSCKACTPINWMMVRSMIRKIERVLKEGGHRYTIAEAGFNEVYAEG
jgi:metal-sulfur cluster biosynthetic enzyme